jgi:hypothetical protein
MKELTAVGMLDERSICEIFNPEPPEWVFPENHLTYLLNKVGAKSIEELTGFWSAVVDGEMFDEIWLSSSVMNELGTYIDESGKYVDISVDGSEGKLGFCWGMWGWGEVNIDGTKYPALFTQDACPMAILLHIDCKPGLEALEQLNTEYSTDGS